MQVSSRLYSAFRFLEKETKPKIPVIHPTSEQPYRVGSRLRVQDAVQDSSRLAPIFRLIENFNAEPLLPGNGFILFNRTSRIFDVGAPISMALARELLTQDRPILTRLARVRPKGQGQVQLTPMADFSHKVETSEAFVAWWQLIGRNFCDGIF